MMIYKNIGDQSKYNTLLIITLLLLNLSCNKVNSSEFISTELKERIISEFVSGHKDERVIIIDKDTMKLYYYENNELGSGYPVPISLGFDPVNIKERRGDGRTPEGEYSIYAKHPSRSFSFFLEKNYPNHHDIERGLRDGLITETEAGRIRRGLSNGDGGIRSTQLGDAIGIHTSDSNKEGYSVTGTNWTLGCIALEFDDMERLYRKVSIGDKVLIIGETYLQKQKDDSLDN